MAPARPIPARPGPAPRRSLMEFRDRTLRATDRPSTENKLFLRMQVIKD